MLWLVLATVNADSALYCHHSTGLAASRGLIMTAAVHSILLCYPSCHTMPLLHYGASTGSSGSADLENPAPMGTGYADLSIAAAFL